MPDLTLSPDERRAACVGLWERWARAVTENRREEAGSLLRLRRTLLKPYPVRVTREEESVVRACCVLGMA